MNEKSKSPVLSVVKKIGLAVALVACAMVIFSGILLNMDQTLSVQSRAGGVNAGQKFSSLPEYGYIMAHNQGGLPTYAIGLGVTLPQVFSAPPALSQIELPAYAKGLGVSLPRVVSASAALSQVELPAYAKGLGVNLPQVFGLPSTTGIALPQVTSDLSRRDQSGIPAYATSLGVNLP